MTAADPSPRKLPEPEAPDGPPGPGARERLGAVLTPERLKVALPLAAAVALGIMLGLRIGQHLRAMTPAPDAGTQDPRIVVQRKAAPCAECDQRSAAAHAANEAALRSHPLEQTEDIYAGLTAEERAYVDAQLRGAIPVGPVIGVGEAPPIHDLPL